VKRRVSWRYAKAEIGAVAPKKKKLNTELIRDKAELVHLRDQFEEGIATRTEESDCFKHERKLTFRN
jgi:hypothetical protein